MLVLPFLHRTQVASLSAELSAERSVSEETRKQVLAARAKANQHQAQVRGQGGVSGISL